MSACGFEPQALCRDAEAKQTPCGRVAVIRVQKSDFSQMSGPAFFFFSFLNDQGRCFIAATIFLRPSGRGDIQQCEITFNTLTSGGLKTKVLSSSWAPHPSAQPFSLHNVLSKFVVSVSSGPRRLNWQSLLSPPSSPSFKHWHTHSSGPFACSSPHVCKNTHRSVFCFAWLLHCELQIPSLGIMTTINSICANVIILILCSMRGLFLNSSWYA